MKRILTVLLCTLLMVFTACGTNGGSSGETSASQLQSSDSSLSQDAQEFSEESPASKETSLSAEVPIPQDYLPFADFMTPGDFENFCLREGFRPNVAIQSPNGEKMIFYRQEEGQPTDLWVVEKESQPQLVLSSEKQLSQNSIKSAMWYNDGTVLLIIGYRDGAVSPGGDVYRLDMSSTTLHLLYRPEAERAQVVAMRVEDQCLIAEIALYDEEYDSFVTETRTIPLLVENAAISRYTQDLLDEDVAGIAVISPEEPEAATVDVLDLDASGTSIYIVPRYAGSDIRLYSVKPVEEGFVNSGWINAVYNTSDDYILRLNTALPQDIPAVKVVIDCFDMHGEFLVSHDGAEGVSVRPIR